MDPNRNLYAQFLTTDRILSFDRILRIAEFCIDTSLTESSASTESRQYSSPPKTGLQLRDMDERQLLSA